jgi:hypothetical protein
MTFDEYKSAVRLLSSGRKELAALDINSSAYKYKLDEITELFRRIKVFEVELKNTKLN